MVAGGLERPSGDAPDGNGDKWSEIVSSPSESEFWANVERLDPKALCTNFANLRKFADWRYEPEPEIYEHPGGINFELGMVPDLVAWREQSLGDDLIGKWILHVAKSSLGPSRPSGLVPRRGASSETRSLECADFISHLGVCT